MSVFSLNIHNPLIRHNTALNFLSFSFEVEDKAVCVQEVIQIEAISRSLLSGIGLNHGLTLIRTKK